MAERAQLALTRWVAVGSLGALIDRGLGNQGSSTKNRFPRCHAGSLQETEFSPDGSTEVTSRGTVDRGG